MELLRWKLTGGPKPRRFRKRLANLHQKIKKWSKTWGAFSKLLRRIILNDQKVQFLSDPGKPGVRSMGRDVSE